MYHETTHWKPCIVLCPPERIEDVFCLRAAVWIAEGADPGAFPSGRWQDERDGSRLHWVVLDDDRVVATASLSIHDVLADLEECEVYLRAGLSSNGRVAAPARVVVKREYRRYGIAQALLDVQDAASVDAGAVLSVRQASPTMRRLLERRGWREHGPAPEDPRFPGVCFTVMSLLFER